MVGLIQKLFFNMIRSTAGEETLAKIKEQLGLPPEHEYQMNNVYSDLEWKTLFAVSINVLGVTEEQCYEIFAAYFLKDSIERFPTWFAMSKNSYELLSIQPTIHNCFATSVLDKAAREAINDKFKIDQLPNRLITHYRSPNQLCSLYKNMAKGVIKYYNDEAEIEEKTCMNEGAAACEIHINWSKLGTADEQHASI